MCAAFAIYAGRGYARHLRKVQQKRQLVDTPAESEAKELKAAVKQAKDKLAAALRTHGDATMVLEHLQDRADKGEDVSDARTDAQQELDEVRLRSAPGATRSSVLCLCLCL